MFKGHMSTQDNTYATYPPTPKKKRTYNMFKGHMSTHVRVVSLSS